jgi:transcriptional regulator with XRE-family HTH domain
MKQIKLGSTLVKFRKQKGCSQKELAEALLISRPTYIAWENDNGEMPLSKLFLLSCFYGFPVNYIIQVVCEENQITDDSNYDYNKKMLDDLNQIKRLLNKY